MASPVNNSDWMEWMATLMGVGSRQAYAATFPPDRFYCLLDELPLHLVPRWERQLWPRVSNEPIFLNSECSFRPANQFPEEVAAEKEARAAFALRGTMAWVRETTTGNLRPFWLGAEFEAIAKGLKPGQVAACALADDARAVLLAANILAPADGNEAQCLQRKWMLEKAAALFRAKGYAPISSLIHPFHVAALRRYYRYLIRTGAIRLGDGQSPRRYVAYNEPVARFFHQQITRTLSLVVGEPIKPSYVYLASYLSGAELKKHTDREQCEFSVTLCLDFSPEPALETSWPIELDTPNGRVKVYQALGDGLAYRGTRLPHCRGPLGEGQTSTSIFFHYVPADFPGPLD
jgi:hypothetical protein